MFDMHVDSFLITIQIHIFEIAHNTIVSLVILFDVFVFLLVFAFS